MLNSFQHLLANMLMDINSIIHNQNSTPGVLKQVQDDGFLLSDLLTQ